MAEKEPPHRVGDDPGHISLPAIGRMVGRSRLVVLVPVLAVLLVAISAFLLGAIQAVHAVWQSWSAVLSENPEAPGGSVTFLKTVAVMLEAVVLFLVGIGLYSLFIAPLNLAVGLGVESLNDLEERVISIVVAVLAVTFLERFIRWEQPLETLQFGGALAVTVLALVLFLHVSHRASEDRTAHHANAEARSKRDMFHRDDERHEVQRDEAAPGGGRKDNVQEP